MHVPELTCEQNGPVEKSGRMGALMTLSPPSEALYHPHGILPVSGAGESKSLRDGKNVSCEDVTLQEIGINTLRL